MTDPLNERVAKIEAATASLEDGVHAIRTAVDALSREVRIAVDVLAKNRSDDSKELGIVTATLRHLEEKHSRLEREVHDLCAAMRALSADVQENTTGRRMIVWLWGVFGTAIGMVAGIAVTWQILSRG